MIRRMCLCLSLLALCGCSQHAASNAARVMDADQFTVSGCKYLGEVQGSSGWGNLAASAGMKNAMNEARAQAAEMGATHVMWTNVTGGYSPFATGRAYECK